MFRLRDDREYECFGESRHNREASTATQEVHSAVTTAQLPCVTAADILRSRASRYLPTSEAALTTQWSTEQPTHTYTCQLLDALESLAEGLPDARC